MAAAATLLLLLAAPSQATAAGAREVIPFSFAWRFFLGSPNAPPSYCNATSFANASNLQCPGLQASSATTAATCLASACSMGHAVWQFCPDAAVCAAGGRAVCWTGDYVPPCNKNNNWVGGVRSLPPDPGPPLPPRPSGIPHL